jgi:hypothetical protein
MGDDTHKAYHNARKSQGDGSLGMQNEAPNRPSQRDWSARRGRMLAVAALMTLPIVAGMQWLPHGRASAWSIVINSPADSYVGITMTVTTQSVGWPIRSGRIYRVTWSDPDGNPAARPGPMIMDDLQATHPELSFSEPGTRRWDAPVVAINVLIYVGASMLAMLGLIHLRRRMLQGRLTRNECLKCGYNLRGLIEQRCPECGQGF